MGKKVVVLLDEICKMDMHTVTTVATNLIDRLSVCILAGSKLKLPSAAQAQVWVSFHQLRCSTDIKQVWKECVPEISRSLREVNLALQLTLDRLLKQMLSVRAKKLKSVSVESECKLTPMESNAVRHMAGYVAVKLLKQFRKPTRNVKIKEKREFFVRVLKSMKARDQPGEPESMLQYTTVWTELIDRGGLYHISDEVS